jgi:hypothetical protein
VRILIALVTVLLSLVVVGDENKLVDRIYVDDKSTFETIHTISENLYNGNGSWGGKYPYRMALRDAYWRADVYGELGAKKDVYSSRSLEVYSYLISVQTEGGKGVFGFPADVNNPEFGNTINRVITGCPECISNGWVVSLPGENIVELYYDHGYALTSLAKGYLRTGDSSYLGAIIKAANWTLDKPLHENINYLSALSKGLSYAYEATGDIRYLNRAIYLHDQGKFPNLSVDSGQALGSHNQQLEYHGFIVSGIVALKRVIPNNHEFHAKIDQFMMLSLSNMQQRNIFEDGSYGVTWPGTNLLAWYELEQLRDLTEAELVARNRCIELITTYREFIVDESDFRLQKSLYSNFFIGLYEN